MVPTFEASQDGRCDLATLDYDLPADLIAQHPLERRDDARMLILDRKTGAHRDGWIGELPTVLRPGDLLVLNDTKVVPAKFVVFRRTGGRIEGLFLRESGPRQWEVLLRGSGRLRVSERLSTTVRGGVEIGFDLVQSKGEGRWIIEVDSDLPTGAVLDRVGFAPLPPYIRRAIGEGASSSFNRGAQTSPPYQGGAGGGRSPESSDDDRSRYQTVYARNPGAVAAPTAGLHFTEPLLDRIRANGIETAFVTLHVGLGTFKLITAATLAEHVMSTEVFDVSEAAAQAIVQCRDRGGRVVAVGTTTVRTLESSAIVDGPDSEHRVVRSGRSETNLFIRPPFPFRAVDALLTNFHLPLSTLLALVMAFAGVESIRAAYRHAIETRYRFYSYGDAMLIE